MGWQSRFEKEMAPALRHFGDKLARARLQVPASD